MGNYGTLNETNEYYETSIGKAIEERYNSGRFGK